MNARRPPDRSVTPAPLARTLAGVKPWGIDHFVGFPWDAPRDRTFGGEVLAQAVAAAGATVGRNHHPAAVHAHFLAGGAPGFDIDYVVTRIQNGRSRTARNVTARQHQAAIAVLTVSFGASGEGPDLQVTAPPVPPPEDLPSLDDLAAAGHRVESAQDFVRDALDIRYVDLPPLVSAATIEPGAPLGSWARFREELSSDALVRACALVYLTDLSVLDAVFLTRGETVGGLWSVSLNHAVYIHRETSPDDWLLLVQRSPSTAGGRGFGELRVFDRTGTLCATAVQECLMREI